MPAPTDFLRLIKVVTFFLEHPVYEEHSGGNNRSGGRRQIIEEKGVLSDRLNSAVDLLVCGTVRITMGSCVVHADMTLWIVRGVGGNNKGFDISLSESTLTRYER